MMAPLKLLAVNLMLFGVVLSAPAKVDLSKKVASANKEKLLKRLVSALHEGNKQPAKQQNDVKARQWDDQTYGMGTAAGYDATGMGPHTGYDTAAMGSHTGYDTAGMVPHTGYDTAAMGDHTGYDTAGMVPHTGYDTAAMGDHTGYDTAGMVPHTGYDTADMVPHTGYDTADMVPHTGYDTAGMVPYTGYDSTVMGHDTGYMYPVAPHDKNLMSREEVIDFFYGVVLPAMDEAVWKLYEEERCQGEIDIGSQYKFTESDSQYSLFMKMEASFRDLIATINTCSGEEVHSPEDVQGMIQLADMVYNNYDQFAGVEELEYYYSVGKEEAMSHAHKWTEDCRLFISALDCNMEHLHEEMMYFLKK